MKILRERKGLALAAIADATKIRASLFASLEHNDLRAWPVGLYRRAYFREYARHLDEPLDGLCEEFNRLFTDEPAPPPPTPGDLPPVRAPRDPAADLRLVFDAKWHGPQAPVLSRLLAAIADAIIIALISGAMMLVSGFDAVVTLALVSLTYFTIGTVLFGESPSKWMMARREAIGATFAGHDAAAAEEPSADHAEPRPWVSDATRVGPPPPPQLRVRFKV